MDKPPTISKTSKNAVENVLRSNQIGKSYVGGDVIEASKRAHPDINWRHLITETENKAATGLDMIDFMTETTNPLIEAGKASAKVGLTALKKQASNSMESELYEIVNQATY